MTTRAEIETKLAEIEQRKVAALKVLQNRRAKLKAQLAQLDRPSKSQRRLDARRKILIGAFVLEQMQHAGVTPQVLTFGGQRFFEWLGRPSDRAVFEAPSPQVTTNTLLKVPFADKDRAKALGAHWHPDQKHWVVPAGLDLSPFKAWITPQDNL